MFDFSWSEIALVGGVALVLIGPKDMPVAMRTIAGFVKKARGMASEFQGHVDEMLREANLTEARDTLRQVRRMDVRGRVMNLLDDDGSLRRSVRDATAPLPPLATPASRHAIALPAEPASAEPPGVVVASTAAPSQTAFTPGPFTPPDPLRGGAAPDAIPPAIARQIVRRATPRPDFLPPGPAY